MNAFVIYFSHAGENFSVGNIKKALSIYGHDVRTSGRKSVECWLKKLGM